MKKSFLILTASLGLSLALFANGSGAKASSSGVIVPGATIKGAIKGSKVSGRVADRAAEKIQDGCHHD